MTYHTHTFDFWLFSVGFCFVFFYTLILNYVLFTMRKNQEQLLEQPLEVLHYTLCCHEKATINTIYL